MRESPCPGCMNLIGADSATAPHASLAILNFRKSVSHAARYDLVEFYRCDGCRAILVRDLNTRDAAAQWALL